jgi:hypothetical protein
MRLVNKMFGWLWKMAATGSLLNQRKQNKELEKLNKQVGELTKALAGEKAKKKEKKWDFKGMIDNFNREMKK